jgi:hypothetical protein
MTLAAPAAAQGCDRACLRTVADSYIAAMVAHDPSKAPLAPGVVTVENLEKIQPGAGLWRTLTAAPGDFRIYVPDPVAQQVGLIAMLTEGDHPIEVGIRLKLVNGRIVEAEHVVVHSVWAQGLLNLKTPRAAFAQDVEEAYRDSRGRLLHIAASYYDALDQNNGSLAPFADDCQRRENGAITARVPVPDDSTNVWLSTFGVLGCAAQLDTGVMSYIDSIDNRRVWIADEQTGLALGLSHFRHSMKSKEIPVYNVPGMATWKMDFKPFDLPAVHIFKIWGGRIHQIEALGFLASFQHPTGWE